jgi:hypothetical protein
MPREARLFTSNSGSAVRGYLKSCVHSISTGHFVCYGSGDGSPRIDTYGYTGFPPYTNDLGSTDVPGNHMPHNAAGLARLLRGADEHACLNCYNSGLGRSPPAPDVFSEFAKGGHPFLSGN